MNIFFRLTQNTFRECVREPVYFLLLLTGLCIIGLLPLFSMFVFRDQIKLVVDSSMAATMILGLVAAALCASHTISREMRNGTVLLLLSKPVPRWSFIAAKLVGVMSALTLFTFVMLSSSFVSIMIAKDQFRLDFPVMSCFFALIVLCGIAAGCANYLKNANFTALASILLALTLPVFAVIIFLVRGAPDDEGFVPPLQFVTAMLLLFPCVWIMGSIAAALSTRVGIVTNLTICSILFFLGLISRYLSTHLLTGTQLDAVLSGTVSDGFVESLKSGLVGLISTVLPDWQYFWMADALANHVQIPFSYLLWALLYSILYAGFWSIVAITLFHEREVARDAVN